MEEAELIDHLVGLTHERFVMLMRKVFEVKKPYTERSPECVGRYYLSIAETYLKQGETEADADFGSGIHWACAYRIEEQHIPDEDLLYDSTFVWPGDPDESGRCDKCRLSLISNYGEVLCPVCNSIEMLT